MREKFTIVIADDDLDDQEIISSGLKNGKIKVNVVSVFDGIRLMDYLLKRNAFKEDTDVPDLILLDLNMPLMDGFEVLREIGKYSFLGEIPIYVITTSRSRHDKAKAIELGAAGFYSKGASTEEIIGILQKICGECFDQAQ
jgi:two-component system response regulator